MKVLLLNGSTRKDGCTYLALSEAAKPLQEAGIETEIVQMGGGAVRDCIGCNGCAGKGQCVFGDDMVNEMIAKAKAADGFVFGSPVYYAHPSGQMVICGGQRVSDALLTAQAVAAVLWLRPLRRSFLCNGVVRITSIK